MTGEVVTVSNGSALPHLESVDRISKIPMVESALGVASGIYGRVKESSSVVNWTFTHAEGVGVAILAPVASRLETPIHAVDNIIAKGMVMVEEAVPAIKMTPKEVLDNTKEILVSTFGLKLPESDDSIPSRVVGAAVFGLRATVAVLEDYMDKYHPVPEVKKPSNPEEIEICGSCKSEQAHVIHRWKVVLTRIREELKIAIVRSKEETLKFLAHVLEYFAIRNLPRPEPVNGCDSDERAKQLIARQGNGMTPPPRRLETVPTATPGKSDNLTNAKKTPVTGEKTPAGSKASDPASYTPVTPKEKGV